MSKINEFNQMFQMLTGSTLEHAVEMHVDGKKVEFLREISDHAKASATNPLEKAAAESALQNINPPPANHSNN